MSAEDAVKEQAHEAAGEVIQWLWDNLYLTPELDTELGDMGDATKVREEVAKIIEKFFRV
jgi:hypothetical protein